MSFKGLLFMLKSMTGYGRVSRSTNIGTMQLEIKCVNSKYCDINLRLPRAFSQFEIPLRALLQEKLARGKIEAVLDVHFLKPPQTPVLNRTQFISCLNLLDQMKTLGGLQDSISLSHILSFNDLVEYESGGNIEAAEKETFELMREGIAALDSMRDSEGKNIEVSIRAQIARLDEDIKIIDKAKDQVYSYWFERFKSKIAEFLPNRTDMEDRIIQEAALFAEKADIKEEIDRANSHCKQFLSIMENEYPCGKKLDFLCQELYREFNTIASKSQKAEIINSVIEAKSIVDSVREQLQNIV
jgi:uncharacterized protein (TIGR00255 family)